MKYTWRSTGHGATDNLGKQVQKIIRTMNQNKIETRHRYIQGEVRFIKYAAKEFKLKKIANVQDKHLRSYVEKLKEDGKSDKYIKNELSAIRFFHNNTPGTKYDLADSTVFNREMKLNSTPDGRADRAWTEREVEAFKKIAIDKNKVQIANVIECIRTTGMRLDEACTLRHNQVKDALKSGKLYLTNTKGGVPRIVLLTNRARTFFENKMQNIGKGEYVLTPKSYVESHKIHSFEKSIQNFIGYYRDKIQDTDRNITGHNCEPGERGALTAHGLRHSFAREQYLNLRSLGMPKDMARLDVSNMLGHGRDSVTHIYLGGIEE